MKRFTADFETATWKPDETWVWAWSLCDIDNPENVEVGNSIESFFERIQKENNPLILFHNLKFDGEFLISYLFNHNFEWVENKEKRDNTFSTLISDMGLFYSIEVYFKVTKYKVKKITFQDSLKIINQTVESMPKTFNIPENKLSIDYNLPREKGHVLTDDEIAYVKNDVVIVAKALKYLYDMGLTKMTAGSNALSEYKNIIGVKKFKNLFRKLSYDIDKDIRQAYKGGFTYLNPLYKNKTVGETIGLDVNSLYPSQMREQILPFGDPVFFKGRYVEDRVYPLYIQRLTCRFKIKKGKIPMIQIKHSRFVDNEYLTDSGDLPVALTLTSIDLKLFLEQYDIFEEEWESGWKFKGMRGLFTNYIDKWIAVKNEATVSGNKGMRQVAKILLNSLYGKYATSMNVQEKIPYLENGIVKYKLGEKKQKDGVYLPMGAFITAYARDKTVRTCQAITDYSLKKYGKDLFYYSDTDSCYTGLSIDEVKQFCEIDDVKLGAWKHETTARRCKFIRQKTYLKEIFNEKTNEWEIKITCAGLPQRCYDQVTWENFKEGLKVDGKLAFTHVKGGIILTETEFTIKEDKTLIKAVQKF